MDEAQKCRRYEILLSKIFKTKTNSIYLHSFIHKIQTMKKHQFLSKIAIITIIIATAFPSIQSQSQQSNLIPFNEENWQVFSGEITEYLGRQSFKGSAMLKDYEFENGIIEFDFAVNGKRSYPGIRFRAQSQASAENIYIRPHIIGHSDDALQYTPIFNREACWQLYNGEGFTTGIDMAIDEWVHFKLEVSGSQARVYIGDTKTPSLKIDYLQHAISKGGIALTAPPNGSAYFSNFKIDTDAQLNFEPPLEEESPPGIITDWEISQPIKYSKIDLEKTFSQQGITDIEWQKVKSEASGLVNLSKQIQRRGREPDFIFAKTTIYSDKQQSKEFGFGYSDWVVVFLNGELLFSGSSPYQGRGTAFLGIAGFYDAIMLPLKKGENELQLIVGEQFGGWGFMFRDNKEIFTDGIKKLWESEKVFTTSESVLYDPKREVIYVTNFDQFNMRNPRAYQFISKVSLTGEIEELKWVDSLNNPLGMTIHNDKLFVTERNAIAEIDLDKGKVVKRHQIPGSVFLNDIAIDNSGIVFITDSRKNVIWKYANGKAEEWLVGDEVLDPNVIYIQGNTLFFGNSGDQSLKSVNLSDKSIKTITKFETGFIDGFRIDENGNYLVSLWKGKIYRVTPDGKKTKILDATTPGFYSADFEYIAKKNLLIVPTFFGNTITGYKLKCDQDKFSATEVKEDFKYLYETLQASSYNLFYFTDSLVFEEEFERLNKCIKDSLSLLDIHRLFQPFTGLAKVSHCNINFPITEFSNWYQNGGKFFPFEIFFDDNKPLIVNNYSENESLSDGDELISINGVPIDNILKKVYKYKSGETEYMIRTMMEIYGFTSSYWYAYGDFNDSSIEIKKPNGEKNTLMVKGVLVDELLQYYENNTDPPLTNSNREFKFIDKVAYLHPGTFLNIESESEDLSDLETHNREEFKEFIDSVFLEISKNNTSDLILDIRGNNGGSDAFSNYMMAYFASSPFSIASKILIKTSRFTKDFFRDFEDHDAQELKKQIMTLENGTKFEGEISETLPRNDSTHFKGNVYVLIDRFSFSMAAAVASIIQDYSFGVIIGEETAQPPSSCASMHEFRLPNTNIKAYYTKAYGIRPSGDTSLRGVIPDFNVKQDIFTDEDEVLDYTVEGIKSGKFLNKQTH